MSEGRRTIDGGRGTGESGSRRSTVHRPPSTVRLYRDLSPRPGALNMAIDQALLERAAGAGECWLRLYTWSPPCLSFGRHEPAERRYDRERIAREGLDVVRRPTGGRAVWHAGELTYALAAPAGAMGGLREAYREVHRVLLHALGCLGADVALAEDVKSPGLDTGSCFARPVGGEIVAPGGKVVGSAQVREGGGLLQHGSILLEQDQSVVRTVTRGAAPPDASAPLASVLGRRVTFHEVADAIEAAARDRWPGPWHEPDPAAVLAQARDHVGRFGSDEWTWLGGGSQVAGLESQVSGHRSQA